MNQPFYKVKNKFAFFPVFIRNRGIWGANSRWVWLRPYTRIYEWKHVRGEPEPRYRTVETVLGWHAKEMQASIDKYIAKNS